MTTSPLPIGCRPVRLTLMVFLSMFLAIPLHAETYDVKDFGGVGDGKTINTAAIQNAINKCRENGGGTVSIPSGTFLTGVIQLFSNVNLNLESGAVLKGSPNLTDYNLNGQRLGMIYVENAENVSITGLGTIDGNGDVFMDLTKAKKIDLEGSKYTRQKEHFREVKEGVADGPVVPLERPFQMIIFSACKNVSVRDVMVSKSPFWTIHFADCDGVVVSGVKIWNSLLVPNNDGIDFTSCSNVLVSDCDIRAGDDAIAITGYDHHFDLPGYKYLKHNSENITVSNCSLISRSCAIRIGGLDQNSMRRYTFNNIVIYDSNRGIGLFARDSGAIEDMTFSNVIIKTRLHSGDWWGNGEPIHLSAVRLTEKVKLGGIRRIKFSHVIAEGESGILVYGTDESIIEDVAFEDVTFRVKETPLNPLYGGNFDLRPVLDASKQIFSHDTPGFFAQHVKNLRLRDIDLYWDSVQANFLTHGIEISDFENFVIDNYRGAAALNNSEAAAVCLRNGKGYRLINSETTQTKTRFLIKQDVSD